MPNLATTSTLVAMILALIRQTMTEAIKGDNLVILLTNEGKKAFKRIPDNTGKRITY